MKFRPLNLPDFVVDKTMTNEEITVQTKQYWNLGDAPIPNMVALLERNGIVVGEFAARQP